MSGYYSTQNGIAQPGNFGMSNTFNASSKASSANYNFALNNAGLVPQSAGVNVTSNVMVALAQPTYVSASNAFNNMNNDVDNGNVNALDNSGKSNYPVNSEQNMINNSVSTQQFDSNLLYQSGVTLSIYPNGVKGPGLTQ